MDELGTVWGLGGCCECPRFYWVFVGFSGNGGWTRWLWGRWGFYKVDLRFQGKWARVASLPLQIQGFFPFGFDKLRVRVRMTSRNRQLQVQRQDNDKKQIPTG